MVVKSLLQRSCFVNWEMRVERVMVLLSLAGYSNLSDARLSW